MNEQYTKWLWSQATPIETTKQRTYTGRIMLGVVALCLVHAFVWSV